MTDQLTLAAPVGAATITSAGGAANLPGTAEEIERTESPDVIWAHLAAMPPGTERDAESSRFIDAILGLVRCSADREALAQVSARTRALARRRAHLAVENTIARAPLTSLTVGGRPAGATHKMITALLVKRYAEAGCPTDGHVALTFGDVARLLGHDLGGWTYRKIRKLMIDLQGVGVTGEWQSGPHRAHAWFAIVQACGVTTAGDGLIHAQLSDCLQDSVRRGCWTYLAEDDMRRLRLASGRSGTPMLLWMWLQTQRLPWRWRAFAAPEGQPTDPADPHCVAALLNLTGTARREVVKRIRHAAAVVMDSFPEYAIRIESAAEPGMWNLFADRRAAVGTART